MQPLNIARSQVRLNSKSSLDDFLNVRIPQALVRSIDSRKLQFAAGRACAYEALQILKRYHEGMEIPIGPQGIPIWPANVLGSITHTRFLARAAVMDVPHLEKDPLLIRRLGIGIDSEVIMPAAVAERVSRVVITPGDQILMEKLTGIEPRVFVTCAFSIKESLYKGLQPIANGVTLGFRSIELLDLDIVSKRFRARLLPENSFGEIEGGVYLEDGHAHTEVFYGFKPVEVTL